MVAYYKSKSKIGSQGTLSLNFAVFQYVRTISLTNHVSQIIFLIMHEDYSLGTMNDNVYAYMYCINFASLKTTNLNFFLDQKRWCYPDVFFELLFTFMFIYITICVLEYAFYFMEQSVHTKKNNQNL